MNATIISSGIRDKNEEEQTGNKPRSHFRKKMIDCDYEKEEERK